MMMKTIVITGASDGIGAEAARQLHEKGANVVIVGRSTEKTKAIAEELNSKYYQVDFTRLNEVRNLAADLSKDLPRIDVLANNAGGIFGNREVTVDGHEKTMQVNHLAHFLLTNLLMEKLTISKATVINTSSVANKIYGKLDINDLEVENEYTSAKAYGNAKLENILFTRELHNRYNNKGISTAAFHPGNIASNFANDTNSRMRYIYRTPLRKLFLKKPAQGADTLVWLATSIPGKDWQSGEYYEKRRLSENINPQAKDPELARKLWEQSAKFTLQ